MLIDLLLTELAALVHMFRVDVAACISQLVLRQIIEGALLLCGHELVLNGSFNTCLGVDFLILFFLQVLAEVVLQLDEA